MTPYSRVQQVYGLRVRVLSLNLFEVYGVYSLSIKSGGGGGGVEEHEGTHRTELSTPYTGGFWRASEQADAGGKSARSFTAQKSAWRKSCVSKPSLAGSDRSAEFSSANDRHSTNVESPASKFPSRNGGVPTSGESYPRGVHFGRLALIGDRSAKAPAPDATTGRALDTRPSTPAPRHHHDVAPTTVVLA